MYAPPPTIRALWATPALGDWAVRDVAHPAPIAGGDGFRLENDNLPDNDDKVQPDEWANTGIGQPVDVTSSQGDNQAATRGISYRGGYAEQTYIKPVSHMVTHSLARETLYNWADARFNVGGIGYPLDYGFGPGAHYDANTVQLYMRPGIWQRPKAK